MQLYNGNFYYKLFKALEGEGFTEDEMSFEKDTTYVSDIGFVSFRFVDMDEKQYIYMSHFLVFKDKRDKTHKNSAILAEFFRKLVFSLGFVGILFSIPKERTWLEKFSSVAFGKAMEEPYKIADGRRYYYMTSEV
jgi:hypothetical protein